VSPLKIFSFKIFLVVKLKLSHENISKVEFKAANIIVSISSENLTFGHEMQFFWISATQILQNL